MLYPKSALPFDREAFINPPEEYRGVPFWAWNCRVTEEKIDRQAAYFKQMGMGGAMVHPRTGMDTPYLSQGYRDLVRHAEEELRKRGMSCWLYDEERFPSGCAGGIVTANLAHRSRVMVIAKELPGDICKNKTEFNACIVRGEKPRGYRLCSYRVELKGGKLKSYAVSDTGAYHAYVELMRESGWYNGQTYSDVFSPAATDEFLRVTHEKYFETLKEQFGKSVPAIFTDEPHMKGKYCLPFPESPRATLAFNEDMDAAFLEKWGRSIVEIAPEVVWEVEAGYSPWRYRYHDFVTERFASCYGDRIGAWCEERGVAYTGHFLSERTLFSQTLALGETMRQYRAQQLPGIDILANQIELTTVKQAESVRRQRGREGLVCELYGVLEWDVSFLEHKLQGDWLAALGVTTRVHHLTFMSMGGEAKRDWPASIGYQSPWWQVYAPLEDYFARINTQLTRGRSVCRVAVLHPIESFWLRFGPNSQTLAEREQMDERFENLAQWLLYGLIDYDYLSEALLPGQAGAADRTLRVGACAYETVIIPELLTVRKTTLNLLNAFADAGGKLIALGDTPRLVDGVPSEEAAALWRKLTRINNDRVSLLKALEDVRDIDIRAVLSGRRASNLVYSLKQDGDERILFVAHVRDEKTSAPKDYEIWLRGQWRPELLDAMRGETRSANVRQENGETRILWQAHCHDSLLLRLTPGSADSFCAPERRPEPFLRLGEPVRVTLHEPNALLLDRARYALDEEPLREAEDILRADNALRIAADLPVRNGDQVQPWLTPREKARHTAHLEYTFYSDKAFEGLQLALEQPENAVLKLNGESVSNAPTGWYVDEDIKTLNLPKLKRGVNVIDLRAPLTRRTNLESMYLLGGFGADARGTRLRLTEKPERIELDDLTRQGLPFYTGNVSYFFAFRLDRAEKELTLKLKHAVAPVVGVKLDGRDRGVVFAQPWQIKLTDLSAGAHEMEITVYGTRYNGFGTLHNANPDYKWYGPNAYRTEGDEWTDNYLVRPWGLMARPELLK